MGTWARFALGIGGLFVVFTALDDFGYGDVAAGLSLLIAGSATMLYLPAAIATLNIPGVQLDASTGAKATPAAPASRG